MTVPELMGSQPTVSIAMATYNGARFLSEQLHSISVQTLLPNELVVSDDGSSDTTLDILRDYARTVPFPVRILDKPERLGFADNFLFAVEHCHGDLIALADQDDVWLPDKLAVGVARIVADDSLLSMHRLTMTDEQLNPIGMWDQGINADRVYPRLALDPLSGWGNTMVFRRELATWVARDERPHDPLMDRLLSHDTWLYILAMAAGRVSHITKPLILYRQHGGNAFGMQKPGWRARLRTMVTVPLSAYRGLDAFYRQLGQVFDRLALRAPHMPGLPGADADAARAAARRYRDRAHRSAMRATLHGDTTISARLRAFGGLYASSDADGSSAANRLLSAIKDFGLGVTGWGRHD